MSLRILAVDDSPSMRIFIGRVLELSGLEISAYLQAADGLAAIEILQREWVDVILTDINMPRMNGEEFMKRLAASGLSESIPVVVISTDGTELRRQHLTALGARGYLVKPFQPEQIRAELERVLGIASHPKACPRPEGNGDQHAF
jgi:two-component system chemotaxis response regulator CheY